MLGKRLSEILLHTKGSKTLVDVGCDHGYLGYEAIINGYVDYVIATDVSSMSLDKARRLFGENGLLDSVDFRCGDGLSVIKPGEADTVVIAGMGGLEIVKILTNAGYKYPKLILSPQSDVDTVRRRLVLDGYRLLHDYIIQDGKFYWIIVAEIGSDTLSEDEYIFGRDNLKGREEFILWLDSEINRFNAIIKSTDNEQVRTNFACEIKKYQKLKHDLCGGI